MLELEADTDTLVELVRGADQSETNGEDSSRALQRTDS